MSSPAASGASAKESQNWPVMRGEQHRGPDRDKGREGDRELKDAARGARPAVRDKRLRPVARRPDQLFVSVADILPPPPDMRFKKSVVERVVDCAEGRIKWTILAADSLGGQRADSNVLDQRIRNESERTIIDRRP